MIGFLEVVFQGLGRGSVFALIALGFVIIYKASHVISFAQPGFMITGVVLVTYLVEVSWIGFWLAVPIAAALFLLGPSSRMITGTVTTIDGGWSVS
jgi:branched-chain amino acid transport system permease protein